MNLQINNFSNSASILRSQRSKNKLTTKNPNSEFKLYKQNSQTKLDKRRSGT
jgi:hypothetical protein